MTDQENRLAESTPVHHVLAIIADMLDGAVLIHPANGRGSTDLLVQQIRHVAAKFTPDESRPAGEFVDSRRIRELSDQVMAASRPNGVVIHTELENAAKEMRQISRRMSDVELQLFFAKASYRISDNALKQLIKDGEIETRIVEAARHPAIESSLRLARKEAEERAGTSRYALTIAAIDRFLEALNSKDGPDV